MLNESFNEFSRTLSGRRRNGSYLDTATRLRTVLPHNGQICSSSSHTSFPISVCYYEHIIYACASLLESCPILRFIVDVQCVYWKADTDDKV